MMVDPESVAGSEHQILVATNRVAVDEPQQRYADGRARQISLDNVVVWVPDDRPPGSLTLPSKSKPDPARQFGVVDFASLERSAFLDQLNQRMAAIEQENTVFLFVHGYNVPYAGGVYRLAQMVADFDAKSVPVLFSWPSSGRLLGYLYDRDSVQFARDGLAEVILLLAQSDATSIFLMGHSMGTMLVMETLRQLSLAGHEKTLRKISPLVLASPDIDVDVFRSQMNGLSHRPDPMIIFVASDDGALRLSQKIRGGHPRIGEGQNIPELQEHGIAVIDLSDVDLGDGTQHSAFAASPTLISIMKRAATASETLSDADQSERRSPLEAMSEFTSGLLYLPNRDVESEP
ncbi:MAG: alpha/beta fold hydrolase [Pseudomonadota bacterium]